MYLCRAGGGAGVRRGGGGGGGYEGVFVQGLYDSCCLKSMFMDQTTDY